MSDKTTIGTAKTNKNTDITYNFIYFNFFAFLPNLNQYIHLLIEPKLINPKVVA